MQEDRGYRVVSLTLDPDSVALAYAARMGFTVPTFVIQDDPAAGSGLGLKVAGSTPWLFVADARGVVVFEGHGSKLTEADEAISALVD